MSSNELSVSDWVLIFHFLSGIYGVLFSLAMKMHVEVHEITDPSKTFFMYSMIFLFGYIFLGLIVVMLIGGLIDVFYKKKTWEDAFLEYTGD